MIDREGLERLMQEVDAARNALASQFKEGGPVWGGIELGFSTCVGIMQKEIIRQLNAKVESLGKGDEAPRPE